MAEFPAAKVEEIIREELQRGQKTKRWTRPQARRRCQNLLAELVVADYPDREGLLKLLRCIFDAQYKLAPICTDRAILFGFEPGAASVLNGILTAVSDAIHETLENKFLWSPDTTVPQEAGEEFLRIHLEIVGSMIASAELGFTAGRNVGVSARQATRFDEALQVCRYLLLNGYQACEFDEHYNRSLELIRQYRLLFEMPVDSRPN